MGLLLLCFIGTGLTWWNYTRQVFSSADGIVLRPQKISESRISVKLPLREAQRVLPGHRARITVGGDPHAFNGEVVTVTPGAKAAVVIIRVLNGEASPGRGMDSDTPGATRKIASSFPPVGARCEVTIDTTIPAYSKDLPK